MPAQQIFNLGRPVVAVLKTNHFWRRAAGTGEVNKIGVGGDDGEPVLRSVLPNSFVRREPGQSGVENVDRIGEEFGETVNELRRAIRVE